MADASVRAVFILSVGGGVSLLVFCDDSELVISEGDEVSERREAVRLTLLLG